MKKCKACNQVIPEPVKPKYVLFRRDNYGVTTDTIEYTVEEAKTAIKGLQRFVDDHE